MSECTHDCSSCSQECSERSKESLLEKPHDQSNIKKVIGVVSGKGGVGKSIVSSMLAVNMKRLGYKTAVLDADITGPSIPKAFGIKEKASGNENGILPAESKTGIEIMSVNLMLDNDTDPVIWRGPVIAGVLDRRYMGRRRLYVCRYASGNRRRSAYNFSVFAGGWYSNRDISSGSCFNDCCKSC